MKIYGWSEEPCECCYGIETEIVPKSQVVIKNGKLCPEDEYGHDLPGQWFKTFTDAKKAQIEYLKFHIAWMKQAIGTIRSQRKNT